VARSHTAAAAAAALQLQLQRFKGCQAKGGQVGWSVAR